MKLDSPKEVARAFEEVIAGEDDDRKLLERLEALAKKAAFAHALLHWGPTLYARDPVFFRPFILAHLNAYGWDGKQYSQLRWKGETAKHLDAWLNIVDADDDIEIFQRLYYLRLTSSNEKSQYRWQQDLIARLSQAGSAAEQNTVLSKLTCHLSLDEKTAVRIYQLAPGSSAFLQQHVPWRSWGWHGKRNPWKKLLALASEREDDELYFTLYRRQVSLADWKEDILSIIEQQSDPVAALEQHHPFGLSNKLGEPFYELLSRSGRTVLPYLLNHLQEAFASHGRGSFDKVLQLAIAQDWDDLWGALVRTCSNAKVLNDELQRILLDARLSDEETIRKVNILVGADRDQRVFGQVISDENAVRLYESFPSLVRGPLRNHLLPEWRQTYPWFMRRALDQRDEPIIDAFASRLVTRTWNIDQPIQSQLDLLVEHYGDELESDEAYARRAAEVLGSIPSHIIYNYKDLIRDNKLARFFLQRSASRFLAYPQAVGDLLESPQIQAQILALRILRLDDDRAREAARDNLHHLLATLLRHLQRKTRLIAFDALFNAAQDELTARLIVNKSKEAMDLPDKRYPKQELIHLIGRILHRFPKLQLSAERPQIYRGAA